MNCYQKILQKNVYRICAGNCKEIASVTTFHRNDKKLVTRTASKNRGQVMGKFLYKRQEAYE